ncbi:MAG: RNA polymerase sigma factor [Pseudomonadota bacterium]
MGTASGEFASTRRSDRVYDEYLVACAQLGDREALSTLAARWQARLVAHAYRQARDPDLARDIVQDAWIDIVRGIRKLSDVAAFPAWAYRIVGRRAADQMRKKIRIRRTNDAYGAEAKIADETQQMAQHTPLESSDADRLRRLIGELSVDHQSVLALFYGEDLSVREVAYALSLPEGTVKTRLMHARKKLKEKITPLNQGDQS